MKNTEMRTIYKDKNGEAINEGMRLRHDDGTVERVYACHDEEGTTDLGFNASNESWLDRTGRNREIYPLYQFPLHEYEIVKG